MAIKLRKATREDEGAVVALWRACELVVAYNDPTSDFRFALAGPSSEILVAEKDRSIVGSVMVGHDGHRGWLYYLAAHPGSRSRGIGRLMVEAAEDHLRAAGVTKVQLMIRETNEQVKALYEHLGFEHTPRIVMAKWLNR